MSSILRLFLVLLLSVLMLAGSATAQHGSGRSHSPRRCITDCQLDCKNQSWEAGPWRLTSKCKKVCMCYCEDPRC